MSEIKTFGYFVNNRWHKPADGAYFESENPATGAVWARVADCRAADIDRAVRGDACFRLNADAIFGGLAI